VNRYFVFLDITKERDKMELTILVMMLIGSTTVGATVNNVNKQSIVEKNTEKPIKPKKKEGKYPVIFGHEIKPVKPR